MRPVANFCDYFLICSASSTRRAGAIAEHIEEGLFDELGLKLKSIEGKREGMWILLDYSDLVIHIFFKDVRDYYALDRLWADAKRVNARKGRKTTLISP